ncbi:MAG TPA: class I SAM-dependent methyltransferase [Candidatus Bathyarchaeia archaeon]|nr:class I SAM-dependent methyltransferase [Candidatus Bathyarchaeia archaeon]
MIKQLTIRSINYIRNELKKELERQDKFPHLRQYVIELNDFKELKKVFNWTCDPVLDDPTLYEFASIVDANERRIRDAECIGVVTRNSNPSVVLEIGTSAGHTTALIAMNAPSARVYTLNIPADEIAAGEGGVLTTHAPLTEEIGSYYKGKELTNITQILSNSATWKPNVGTINVAFVDGCHDSEFVYNDSCKILKAMVPGSFILWHDFNLNLTKNYRWIESVCLGVEKLYRKGWLRSHIFHVRDSWVGVCQID